MLRYLIAHTRLALAVLTISTLVGLIGAKLNTAGVQVSAATAHVMVDLPGRSLVERRALQQHVNTLQKRAEIFGRMMVTTPVLERIGRRAGLPGDQIAGVARTTASVPIPLLEPGSEVRATQIVDSKLPYHLELQSSPSEPVLAIYSQAPSPDEARRLANAAGLGLQDYLDDLAAKQDFPAQKLVRIRPLGDARGGVINARARAMTAALTFMVGFGLTCALLLALLYRRLRRHDPDVLLPRPDRPVGLDNWPRTSRILPWLLAGFIAMLWLVPFNKIQLAMSTPIDMKLDRLVLPRDRRRVAARVRGRRQRSRRACGRRGCISRSACSWPVHSSAWSSTRGYLNQTLEFELAFKRLPLLVSYVSIFVHRRRARCGRARCARS